MNDHEKEDDGPFSVFTNPSFTRSVCVTVRSPVKGSPVKGSPVKALALPGSSELDTVILSHDREKIKRFVRAHHWPVNHEIRHTLFYKICESVHGKQLLHANPYAEIVSDVFGEG